MAEKLSEFVGNIKCDKCGHKFFKSNKNERPSCESSARYCEQN